MRGLVDSLQVAIKQCQQALDYVLANPQQSASLAYGYMMLFGNSVAYWLMVKLALAAQKAIDQGSNDRFYAQKVATTEFFAHQLLTRNYSYLSSVTGGSSYLDSLDDKDFTTIQ